MKTNLKSEGRGPAVILIHGLGLDLSMWDRFAKLLVPDYTVIRYDLLGHGQSDPISSASLEALDAQLLRVLDDAGLNKAVLVGLSLGGVIARSFAARHPHRVSALALLNTISRRTPAQKANVLARADQLTAGQVDRVTEAAIERWFSDDFQQANKDVVDGIRRRLLSNDPGSYLACYRLFATVDERAASFHPMINAPTIVITGADDVGSTPSMAEEITGELSDSELSILPQLRHLSVIEDPVAVYAALKDFLFHATAKYSLAGE